RFAEGDSSKFDGRFSPDGRFVAYVSDESGSHEIYVQPFNPAPNLSTAHATEKWLVSKGGGDVPHWRSDGKELLYQAVRTIVAVDVKSDPTFQTGEPKRLFDLRNAAPYLWDVAPDGKKFLVTMPIAENTQGPFNVVLNWPSMVK